MEATQAKFVKVIPKEYKRVLAAISHAARQAGIPEDQAVMRRRMGKTTGFIEFKRAQQPYRPVAERVRDWRQVMLPLADDE